MLDHTHTTVSLIDLLISLNEQKELQYMDQIYYLDTTATHTA